MMLGRVPPCPPGSLIHFHFLVACFSLFCRHSFKMQSEFFHGSYKSTLEADEFSRQDAPTSCSIRSPQPGQLQTMEGDPAKAPALPPRCLHRVPALALCSRARAVKCTCVSCKKNIPRNIGEMS
uniref:Uncharacterized protein n=1 Tax=Pipistrellus kuhlii TaxID=59472 RepID=A0A7J7XUU3_PIPKU|nr:hypothetical protein mPipKuh1_010433 [Pipistrellus kuhlii]